MERYIEFVANGGQGGTLVPAGTIREQVCNSVSLEVVLTVLPSTGAIVPVSLVTSAVYAPSQVPTVYGVLQGATHFTAIGNLGEFRGPLTAWLRLNLMQDDSAHEIFYGGCELCADPRWVVQRKNI